MPENIQQLLWIITLLIGSGFLYFLKKLVDEIKALRTSFDDFRVQVPQDYVSKNDCKEKRAICRAVVV